MNKIDPGVVDLREYRRRCRTQTCGRQMITAGVVVAVVAVVLLAVMSVIF